jgi:ParB/RepB/Spo0J family partition protein
VSSPPAFPSPAPPAAAGYPIAKITVGARHRRDLGDIARLAACIADVGLLHPIVVKPDGRLIAGRRRLEACKKLGWAEMPVHVVDLEDIERGELAENIERKDFLPSEIDAIRREHEAKLKAQAKEHMSAGGKGAKVSQPLRTTDKIGAFAGVSGRTIEKIAAVVAAAEAEPEKYSKLVAAMDRTGRVNGVFKRLKVLKQAEVIRAEPPPLPGNGPYRVFTIDPPWKNEVRADDPSHRTNSPFPPMSVDEICKLEIRSIAKPDSIVWLWVTDHQLLNGIHNVVLDAWGLKPRALLTWVKTNNFGTGDWLRGQTEHCVMATWGTPVVTLSNESTVLFAPARGHSVKPPEFYDLVEKLCPAPRYADLFSRYRHNDRWDCHGDEAPPLAEREAAE